MRHLTRPLTGIFLCILIITGCKKDSTIVDNIPGNDIFVSATSLGNYPKTALQAFAVATGFGSYANLIKYDVDFYKLIYKTTFKGRTIQASGLLALPKNVPVDPSLLSAQHGTMFKATDAPSNFPATFTGYEIAAAAGFATVIPDYIGYGVSQNIPHPYYDQQYSAGAVVDMIRAAKYYLAKQNFTTSNRLFLIGYSEGGYVTMAAQKEIETNPVHSLTLTAAAAGAGSYDLPAMLSGITASATYAAPSFLALLVHAYDSTYNWNRPYTDFFQQPYADKIPALLNGSKKRSEIDAALTTSTSALFNPAFFAALKDPGGETTFKQLLAANSFLTWVPKSPTRLYHGSADEVVFYQTAVNTVNRFKAAGATNVEFVPIPDGTHESSIQPMITSALSWVQSLDK